MNKVKITIHLDLPMLRIIKKLAEDRGRNLSSQSIHLIRLGLTLMEADEGNDGLERLKKFLRRRKIG